MRRVQRALRTPCADRGAAAVEFALIFPIFALLSVGMISGGLVLWRTIAATQAARDAARLASTTPIAPATPSVGEVAIEDWLRRAMFTALQGAGWTPTSEAAVRTTDLNRAGEQGYACVAYVKGLSGTLDSQRLVIGATAGGEPGPNLADPDGIEPGVCYADNPSLTSARVQVILHRKEQWNLILSAPTWTVYSTGNIPYERAIP